MKRILLLAATALLMGSVAFAQHHEGVEKVVKKTEHMAHRYGLNELQKAQLLELNKADAEKRARKMELPGFPGGERPEGAPEFRPGEGPRPEFRGNRGPGFGPGGPGFGPGRPGQFNNDQQLEKEYRQGIKKIFTKDQFKAYKKDIKSIEKERKHHRK